MEKALAGLPESFMDQPEGLSQVTAHDLAGKTAGKEFVYRESIPPPPAPEEDPAPLPTATPATPAPVQDAKPKAVEKKN